ncbi:hypothetical protein T36_1794 [Helicobacter cinaedi]|nr:hypothetical protein [Helicobacter cinaedi]BDB65318.1 hypothetical protein T36_1794 [Helicobacter cinaedi]
MKKFVLMALSLSFLVYVLARILHLVPKATSALKSKIWRQNNQRAFQGF